MRKLKGITINGEWLGDNIVINVNFRAICSFAPFVVQEFAKIINSLNKLNSKVVINNFYFPDNNSINIEFFNNEFSGEILLCFKLTNGTPEICNKKIVIYKDNPTLDEKSEQKNDSCNIAEKKEINKNKTEGRKELNNQKIEKNTNTETIVKEVKNDTEEKETGYNKKSDLTNHNQHFSHKLPKRDSNIVKSANIEQTTFAFKTDETEKSKKINNIEQTANHTNDYNDTNPIVEIKHKNETINKINPTYTSYSNNDDTQDIKINESINLESQNINLLEDSKNITNIPVQNNQIEKNNFVNTKNYNDIVGNVDNVNSSSTNLKTEKTTHKSTDIADTETHTNLKENNSTILAMLDEILVLREELNKLKSEKITSYDISDNKDKINNIIEDENADFRIMGSQKRLNANILDEDLFIAGNRLYRWGDTLYLDE